MGLGSLLLKLRWWTSTSTWPQRAKGAPVRRGYECQPPRWHVGSTTTTGTTQTACRLPEVPASACRQAASTPDIFPCGVSEVDRHALCDTLRCGRGADVLRVRRRGLITRPRKTCARCLTLVLQIQPAKQTSAAQTQQAGGACSSSCMTTDTSRHAQVVGDCDKSLPLLLKVSGSIPRALLDFEQNRTFPLRKGQEEAL